MKILVLNGPNLNMLGERERFIYGTLDYKALLKTLDTHAKEHDVKLEYFQSNHEGELIDEVQDTDADALIVNFGGLTHTSISLRDALSARALPAVEVHISNIYAREEFRHKSFMSGVVTAVICGMGFDGYKFAIDYLVKQYA